MWDRGPGPMKGIDFVSTDSSISAGPRWFDVRPGLGHFLAILTLVTLFRIVLLYASQAELYFDEAQYWAWSKEPAFGYFTKPPLLAWLIGLSTGICGDSAFCARVPSPLLHMATTILIYLTADRLFDRRVAFWAGILHFISPGVAVSAILISTDVPLLFFWCMALLATTFHIDRPTWISGVALGVAVGLGLNAKYAMIYFLLCFVLFCVSATGIRHLLWNRNTLLALAIAMAFIAPNILWNAQTDFATFSHTKGNASWGNGRFPNFKGLLEFIGIQAVILGPVAFVAAIMAVAGPNKLDFNRGIRFALFFSVPVFTLISMQAFISKANGNWAATAFPATAIIAAAGLLGMKWRLGLAVSLGIGALASFAVPVSTMFMDRFTSGPVAGEFSKMSGAGDFAQNIRRIAQETDTSTVVFGGRALTASMLFELRDSALDIRSFTPDPQHPSDHFQLRRPWSPGDPGPVLLVFVTPVPDSLVARLQAVEVERIETRIYIAKWNQWTATAYRIP